MGEVFNMNWPDAAVNLLQGLVVSRESIELPGAVVSYRINHFGAFTQRLEKSVVLGDPQTEGFRWNTTKDLLDSTFCSKCLWRLEA